MVNESGWRVIKSRRTVRWRGKRMVLTFRRQCYALYIERPKFFVIGGVASEAWKAVHRGLDEGWPTSELSDYVEVRR